MVLSALFISDLWAQIPFGMPRSNNTEAEAKTLDSLKSLRDSIVDTRPQILPYTQNACKLWNELDTFIPADSSLTNVQWYTPMQQSWKPIGNIGSPGSPELPLYFSDPQKHIYTGLNTAYTYMFSPENFNFHRVGQAFTQFDYSQGDGGLIGMNALHSQNFSPTWNVSLNYRSLINDNHYVGDNQDNLIRNIAFGSDFTSLNTRYRQQIILTWNRNRRNENFGLLNDTLFYGVDSSQTDWSLRKFGIYYPTNQTASSFLSNTKHLFKHKYFLDTTLNWSLEQSIVFTRDRFEYTDRSYDSSVYLQPLRFGGSSLQDSSAWRQWNHKLGINWKSNFIPISTQIFHEYNTLKYLYQANDSQRWVNSYNQNNIGLNSIFRFNKILFTLDGSYTLSGYGKSAHYFEVQSTYKDSLSEFGVRLLNQNQPFSIYFKYFQNAFSDFKSGPEINDFTSNRLVKLHWQRKQSRLQLLTSLTFGSSNNTPLFFTANVPAQINNWNYLKNQITTQFQGDNWGVYISSFYQFNSINEQQNQWFPNWFGRFGFNYQNDAFKKALFYRLGVDFTYYSKYNSLNYNPIYHNFQFNQTSNLVLGNYPIISFYAISRIQTIDIFFKYEHWNEWIILPNVNKRYETILQYPIQPGRFRFGFQWKFWN